MLNFLFFLSSRLFLSNKVVTNLTLNNKLSKKLEGAWYYVKCQKNRNCSDVISEIKNRYNISDISVINNNAFTIYFTQENSKILKLFNLKYTKIPKKDKIIETRHNPKKMSNNYLVYLSKMCEIPYNTTEISSNYLIFQSDEPLETVSQKLSKIGCIRSFQQLPIPRLNSRTTTSNQDIQIDDKKTANFDSNTSQNRKMHRKHISHSQIDTFPSFNTIQDESSDDDDGDGFTQILNEKTVFSLHSSHIHRSLMKHGINGEGQVASIVDTGLDQKLCWFVDPEREIEFGREVPSDHRKIQGYFSYADYDDVALGGHGSFVAGLIAGSAQCDMYVNDKCAGSYFDGVAPNAKLVVNDVFFAKRQMKSTARIMTEVEKIRRMRESDAGDGGSEKKLPEIITKYVHQGHDALRGGGGEEKARRRDGERGRSEEAQGSGGGDAQSTAKASDNGATKNMTATKVANNEKVSNSDSKSSEKVANNDSKHNEKVGNSDSKSSEKVGNSDSKSSEKVENSDSKSSEKVENSDSKTGEKVVINDSSDSKSSEKVGSNDSKHNEKVVGNDSSDSKHNEKVVNSDSKTGEKVVSNDSKSSAKIISDSAASVGPSLLESGDHDNKIDEIDERDQKEDALYKKKVRDERKMRSKFKRKQKIENPVDADEDKDNELVYYNPYDSSHEEQIIATFPANLSKLFVVPWKLLNATVQYHGFDFQEKSLFTSLIDTFAYENPRMLLVFPAGDKSGHQDRLSKSSRFENKQKMINDSPDMIDALNDAAVIGMSRVSGVSYDSSMLTTTRVSSPGDSKNVLTVGATVINSKVSINEFEMLSPIVVVNKGAEYLGYCDEFYGISFFEYVINSMQFSIEDEDQRAMFNRSFTFRIGTNVFVETEKVDTGNFIQTANFELTSLLLLFNAKELTKKIDKPIIRLPEDCQKEFSNGDVIEVKFFNDIGSLHIKKMTKNEAKYSRENPHYFRRKPDIYMPGGPAYGPNSGALKTSPRYCGIEGVRMGEGTSVAAAFATGDVLLIQQYISGGYCGYYKGEVETTSHMLRAILSNIAIGDITSPKLNRFCIFKDDYNMSEIGGIRFFNDFLSSFSFHTYRFKAQFDGTLRVTVCWNDPPHDPFAPSDVLFKVDCRIEVVQNGTIFGDVHYDPFNTLKSYNLFVKKDEEYNIYVTCGDNLFFEKMNYTIVISGPFDHFSPENVYVKKIENQKSEVKCLQTCQDNSKCVNGFCQCAKKKFGEDCSKEMIEMHNHQTVADVNLLPRDSVFMSYVFKQWKPGSKLSFTFSIKRPNTASKNEDTDGEIGKRLFFMFSINKVPSWQNANCNSENCQWASIRGNSLTIEYHLWNFVRNGDTLYLVAYSIDSQPLSFSVLSTELYT